MSDAATITVEREPMSKYRLVGATISENDCWSIDPNFRLSQARYEATWLANVLDEIDQLAKLPAGWDSNGAGAPDPKLVAAGRDLIGLIADPVKRLPAPTVVTTSRSGGIQFEWGVYDGVYCELECVTPDEIEFYFVDHRNLAEHEGRLPIHCHVLPERLADFIRRTNQDV